MLNSVVGSGGGYLVADDPKRKPKRLGYFVCSMPFFKEVFPVREVLDALRMGQLLRPSEVPEWGPLGWRLHDAMLLPANCEIDAVSPHYSFRDDCLAFRVRCDDFVVTQELAVLPDVDPRYYMTEDLLGRKVVHFDGWSAGTVPEYVPPPKPDTGRCSEELGHFPSPDSAMRYCHCMELMMVDGKWIDKKEAVVRGIRRFGGVLATWQPEAHYGFDTGSQPDRSVTVTKSNPTDLPRGGFF